MQIAVILSVWFAVISWVLYDGISEIVEELEKVRLLLERKNDKN